jgi:4'-phosphopantetheinyl transferase
MNVMSTSLTSARVNVFQIEGALCRRKPVHAVLSSYLRCGEVFLSSGAFGKPKLLRPASEYPIEFSVSYRGDRCLVAMGRGGVLGIDVERRQWIGDLDAVASIYFTPGEASWIEKLHGDQKLEAFFACWTFKEAYSKAIGTGLLTPFHTFALPAASRKRAGANWATIHGCEWTHLRFEPWPGYTATVVAAGRLSSSAFQFQDYYARNCA